MGTDHGFILKLERAREHLNSFQIDAAAWIDTKPYGIVDEPDPKPLPQPIGDGVQVRRLRVDRVTTSPIRLNVLVGECVFNLRSALDHLAFALAETFTPGWTEKQQATSEFPIFSNGVGYPKATAKKIGCINPTAQIAINALQPYHRGNAYQTHPLWQIHELNRIDKHRTLTACTAWPIKDGVKSVGMTIRGDENVGGIYYAIVPGDIVLNMNAILMQWAGTPRDPSKDMYVHPSVPLEIVFEYGSIVTGKPVIPLLKSLCDFVSDSVIAPLSKFL